MQYRINSCNFSIKEFIREIAVNEFGIDYWNEWLEEQDYNILKMTPNLLISVEENNRLIGICSIKKIDDERCYLNSFYVKKEFRNKGIGNKLFDMCLKYAKNNNYKKVLLSVDPNFKQAIEIYQKKNFIFDYFDEERQELWYYKNI